LPYMTHLRGEKTLRLSKNALSEKGASKLELKRLGGWVGNMATSSDSHAFFPVPEKLHTGVVRPLLNHRGTLSRDTFGSAIRTIIRIIFCWDFTAALRALPIVNLLHVSSLSLKEYHPKANMSPP